MTSSKSSLRQISKSLGISTASLSYMVNGKRPWRADLKEKYNLINHAHGIRVPMLTLNGSLETHSRLRDMAQDLAAAAVNSPKAETLMVEGGEHSLVDRTTEASDAVLKWLAALTPERARV